MTETDKDIETVRRAVAGMAYVPVEASAAFQRIVTELERLKTTVEDMGMHACEREEAREVGE